MHRTLACVAFAVAVAASGAAGDPGTVSPVAYVLDVHLEPAQRTVRVAGTAVVVRSDLEEPTLAFALHQTFAIDTLTVNGIDAEFTLEEIEPTSLSPASRRVVVKLPEKAREAFLDVGLSYGGSIAALPQFGAEGGDGRWLDDVVAPSRVELAWYSAWFPQFTDYGASFRVGLTVDLPAGWSSVSNAQPGETQDRDGRLVSHWMSPASSDIVLVAAPGLQRVVVDRGGGTVEIYHTRLPAEFIERETANATETLELYEGLLGAPRAPAAAVRVVYSPRSRGQGGFTRPMFIVLSEGRVLSALAQDPRLSLLHGIAHEAAHFWWNFGRGQGDWINEAFAEYFALLAVERIDSPDSLAAMLDRYRSVVDRLAADAPALADIQPTDLPHGYAVRYVKGSLMLDALRRAMGDDAFLAGCREFYEARRGVDTSTDDLRAFWGPRLGDRAALLDEWLTAPGGRPHIPE